MLDLTIFPLSLTAEGERYELPGLLVSAAPRKAARTRAQDYLLLYLRLNPTTGEDSDLLPVAQQQEILHRLVDTYFSFPGSITSGLRSVVNRLNEFLLNRNLRSAQVGQLSGTLNLAVVHSNSLIIGHAGATHSYVLARSQVQHFDDSATQGSGYVRGLGLSRQAVPRFYQTELQPGDLLVVCPEPPASWTSRSMVSGPQPNFELLRRRMLSDAGGNLQAVAARFESGKGHISYWRPGDRAHHIDGAHQIAGGHQSGAAGRGGLRGRVRETLPAAQGPSASPAAPILPADQAAAPQALEKASESTSRAETTAGPAATAEVPAESMPAAPEAAAQERSAQQEPDAVSGEVNQAGVESFSASGTAGPEGLPEVEDLMQSRKVEADQAQLPAAGTGESINNPAGVDAAVFHPGENSGSIVQADGIYLGGGSAAPAAPSPRPGRREHSMPVHARPRPGAASMAGGTARQEPVIENGPADSAVVRQRRLKVQKPGPERDPDAFRRRLAGIWHKGSAAKSAVGGTFTTTIGRVAPQRQDAAGKPAPLVNLSAAWMMTIAILVPLIVVTVAMTVYLRAGRSEQFQILFAQAQQYAQQAQQQTDPSQQRESWSRAYETVLKAEAYGQDTASTTLHQQALTALDGLENFIRLDYVPAMRDGFSLDVKITSIAATLNDLYLLDSGNGRILRMYRTSSGYEVDPKFSCGSGKAGGAIVGPLIDMVALPPNNDMHATVMGIDSGGNLVYCSPSLSGFDSVPLAMPDAGWGTIAAITSDGDSLYVLDPKGNAVYRYDGAGSSYTEKPHLYFDNAIPKMNDVIDLAVDQESLYMLHADGRMTICESGGFSFVQTKCTDPAPYGDQRAGYEPNPLSFSGARFTQLQTTQPPDPSLYILDQANDSIYHLSLRRLNLQRQYRPKVETDFPLPNTPPTAFAIAPNRRALLAFGNQLFFASIP